MKNRFTDPGNGGRTRCYADGLFFEVGLSASPEYALNLLEANGRGEIHVDRELITGVRGVFATGDLNDGQEKQAIVAAVEGARYWPMGR